MRSDDNQEEVRMDMMALAVGAVTLLSPFVRKAAEEFSGEVGKKIWATTARLFSGLKEAFTADRKATEVLSRYERDPESERDALSDVLAARMGADAGLAAMVEAAITEAKRVGGELRVVQKVVEAERVVGLRARRLDPGRSVDVDQDVKHVTEVTGIIIDDG
jgi:hypothetical protein